MVHSPHKIYFLQVRIPHHAMNPFSFLGITGSVYSLPPNKVIEISIPATAGALVRSFSIVTPMLFSFLHRVDRYAWVVESSIATDPRL